MGAMQNLYDYKRFAVLYVDDEEKSLKYFERAFEDQFRILTASRAQEGFRILEEHKDDIGILITDQRMPGEKGVWLLEKARELRPGILRILATAYADMEAAISAVNSGAIYKYVTKPWDPPELETTLRRGLEFFMVQRERDQLLKEKMSVLHNMMIADRIVSLGILAAGMSHHIRNSLVAVKTFLDLTPSKLREENVDLDHLRNPDFWKEYYRNVQSQVEKMSSLLKELWAASEKPAFEFKDSVRLYDVISAVAAKLEPEFKAKRIQLVNLVPNTLPELLVDKAKFYRLFELLFKDEIASLPLGSEVKISAQPGNTSTRQRAEVQVQVRDNGPGLPEEALRMIFDPFVVRSDSPMEYGISLMACYFIIHNHGGKITASSKPGQGTTFNLRLLTNPNEPPSEGESQEFLQKVLLNDTLWGKLLVSD
jgi:two-component system, probable response regulator PhcQ